MDLKVKIYSCYQYTYKKIYKDVLKYIYGDIELINSAKLEIIDVSVSGALNIQSQRSSEEYAARTINIFENDCLKHIVGISNTNFDYDRQKEFEEGKSNKVVSQFGKLNYHANTYLKQGIPAIFNYYYENKNDDVDLTFYLLDLNESYPHNLYNILSYRELETIGFKILNIDKIDFSNYNKKCKSLITTKNIKFSNVNKYYRDICYVSERNKGNNPSTLECYEHITDNDESYITDKYIFTFKTLSAQGYDSLLRCWCLKVLAKKENTDIEFRLGKQFFAFNEENKKIANKLTGPILDTFKYAGINIEYISYETFMNEKKKADDVYSRYKQKGELRNQILFRNNLRKKGVPMECPLCGEDNAPILDAAHLYEVNMVKKATLKEINEFIKNNNLDEIIDADSQYKNEEFYKKYCIVNSGDNGIWLCKNHHGLFDKNYYCFESENGKIVLHFKDEESKKDFLKTVKKDCKLIDSILTNATKAFLRKRALNFGDTIVD